MEEIKLSIVLLVCALCFGTIGATLLYKNIIIMGAVCMLVTGFILGTMFGYIISMMDGEE